MPGALKVQTAPGVWATVGGQAPGLDQAAADLRYVKLAGDTMVGGLIINGAGLRVHGNHSVEFHDDAGTTRRGSLVALADRLTLHADGTLPILFEANAVEAMRVADVISMSVPLLSKAAGTFKSTVSLWNTAQAATALGIFNKATDEVTPGTRLGYLGSNTGTDEIRLVNETGTNLFLGASTAAGRILFYSGGLAANTLRLAIEANGVVKVTNGSLAVGMPADYWSQASTGIWVGTAGGFGSLGSNRVGMWSNSHRTPTGWSAPGTAGTTGIGTVECDPVGAVLFRVSSTTPTTSAGPPEIARVSAGGTGSFLMGKTAASQTTKGVEFRMPGHVILNTGDTQMDTNIICDKLAGTAVSSSPYARWLAANVIKGSITYTGTAIAYNTTSHAPWKGNVTPLDGDTALAMIQQLRPVSFQWKLDADGMPTEQGTPSGEVAHGFVAQELFEVVPEAVTPGSGDEAEHNAWLVRRKAQEDALAVDPQAVFDEDIDPVVPWQIDPSKIIPDLVAAVQALAARVIALETAA